MTIGSKYATLVMAVTCLIFGILVAAVISIPTTAQKSSDSLSGDDITSSYGSNMFDIRYFSSCCS